MIVYEPVVVAHLPDKQLAIAIAETTVETNRCYAEFMRLPTGENSIAYNKAMHQWLVLTGELEHRAWQREYRQILLQATTVQRIQL